MLFLDIRLMAETLNSMGYLKNKWFKKFLLNFFKLCLWKVETFLTIIFNENYLSNDCHKIIFKCYQIKVEKEFANLKPPK